MDRGKSVGGWIQRIFGKGLAGRFGQAKSKVPTRQQLFFETIFSDSEMSSSESSGSVASIPESPEAQRKASHIVNLPSTSKPATPVVKDTAVPKSSNVTSAPTNVKFNVKTERSHSSPSIAFEVKLNESQFQPLGSFKKPTLPCHERAMARWAETLRQMLRVEGNRQTFLEARREAMREESQRVLQAQVRKSIMGVRPVLHGESLLSELPAASVTAMPASRGGVAFFMDHHPDASKPDWLFRKHSIKYLSNQIANKMATVCRNKHASLNERQQRVRERLRRLLQARTQMIATDIKNRQLLSERIGAKMQQVTQQHQAFLNRRREQLRGQLAKIAEVRACKDVTAIKKSELLAQKIANKQARASENRLTHLQKKQQCLKEKPNRQVPSEPLVTVSETVSEPRTAELDQSPSGLLDTVIGKSLNLLGHAVRYAPVVMRWYMSDFNPAATMENWMEC